MASDSMYWQTKALHGIFHLAQQALTTIQILALF